MIQPRKSFFAFTRSAGLLALLIVGGLSGTSPRAAIAQASATRAGNVYFSNRTEFPLTIQCNSYLGPDGDSQKVTGSWTLEPAQGAYLKITTAGGDVPIRARQFNYRVTTSVGSSDWSTSGLDADGDLTTIFTKENLATHWRLTARTEAPNGLVETKSVRTVAKTGAVAVRNTSRFTASVTGVSYLDASGVKKTLGTSWVSFAPGELASLGLDGRQINASRFDLSVVINGKTSNWYIESPRNLEGDQLVFVIDDQVLSKHRTLDRSVATGGPSEIQVQNAIAKLIGAMVAQGVATSGNAENDGIGDLFVRGLAIVGREALIKSAVEDLFGSRTGSEQAAACRVIGLVLEGRLTQADLSRATTEDAIKGLLKREAPELSGAVEIVDFLAKLKDARDKAR